MAEVLTEVDMVNGIITTLMVIINIGVGLTLIIKSRKVRNNTILYMGLALILLCFGWIANALNFLLIISNFSALTAEAQLAIALFPYPISLFFWMVVITELLLKKKQKQILIVYLIYAIIFDSLVVILLQIDPALIGTIEGPLNTGYSPLIFVLLLIMLLTVLITSILFFNRSRRAESREARLKGNLFLFSSILLVIGAIIDSVASPNVIIIFIVRVMLLLSAFGIYWTFLLPDYIKKIFIKTGEKDN